MCNLQILKDRDCRNGHEIPPTVQHRYSPAVNRPVTTSKMKRVTCWPLWYVAGRYAVVGSLSAEGSFVAAMSEAFRRALRVGGPAHGRPPSGLPGIGAHTLVAAPDTTTWIGRRDRALLLLAIQTGLRNSEITSLKRKDAETGTGAHVRCLGKGRKLRCTPLRPDVAAVLKQWLSQQPGGPDDPLFPASRGGPLSADAVQRLVSRHVQTARRLCPSLVAKRVTPHTLRHAAAMALLHRGVDLSVIALWLGHESRETTQIYLHADMQLKQRALAHANPSGLVPDRYRPADPVLAFLESL